MVPVEVEAGEVFAEAVGIVGASLTFAGGVEEEAAGLGEGAELTPLVLVERGK
jgi:hypothetical protein